jgi:parvulin-like peptidyl-prolyl isomerase
MPPSPIAPSLSGTSTSARRARTSAKGRARRFVATLLSLQVLALAAYAQAPMRDDDVVARVNGTPIYRKAVKDLVQGSIVMQDREPDAAAVAQLADDALQSLIALELLYQESQARGITVSDAEVDAEITRSKQRFPDAASFKAALKANRMTEADLRRDTRKTMAVNRLLEGGVLRDVKIGPDQINAFYERNKDEFKHPEEVRASHILFKVPEKASPAERSKAQQKAEALLKQLRAGADFQQAARDQSQDPMTAAHGGDRGFFARGEMDEAFEKSSRPRMASRSSRLPTAAPLATGRSARWKTSFARCSRRANVRSVRRRWSRSSSRRQRSRWGRRFVEFVISDWRFAISPINSFSDEHRRTLVFERLHGLGVVGGAVQVIERKGLVTHLGFEGRIETLIQRLARELHRERRTLTDLGRQRARRTQQFGRWDDSVDEADALALGGPVTLAGEHQLTGAPETNQPRQQVGRAEFGHHAHARK